MHILVPLFLIIAVIALLPGKWAVAFCALLVLIPIIVKFSAQLLAHVETGFLESAKAVAYSLGFALLFLLALVSASKGHVHMGPVLLLAFFVSYVFGFKLGLGTSFGVSAGIAAVSTVVSGVLIWMLASAL